MRGTLCKTVVNTTRQVSFTQLRAHIHEMKAFSFRSQLFLHLSIVLMLMGICWNAFLTYQYHRSCELPDFSPDSRSVAVIEMPPLNSSSKFQPKSNISHLPSHVPLNNTESNEVANGFVKQSELVKTAKAEHSHAWYPQYYSTNMTRLLNRGANFITPLSGCFVASWVVTTGAEAEALDCNNHTHEYQVLQGNEHLVQAYDTIYVPIKSLANFNEQILPKINAPVVVIAGQYLRLYEALDAGWQKKFLPLYSNAKVIRIFAHNAIEYAKQDHPKLEPFPFGLQHEHYDLRKPTPLEVFREAFFHYLELPEKADDIFISYLGTFRKPQRRNKPNGPKMRLRKYYDHVAKSKFMLSPNGDRPECYRHYEAIGLGTIPITELDPHHYRHLRDAPVIYNTSTWTLLN